MSNELTFKVTPTQTIDSVSYDLPTYDVTKTYTVYDQMNFTLTTSGVATVISTTSASTTVPFIEVISDQNLTVNCFANTTSSTPIALTKVKYLAGNIDAYSFSVTNTGTQSATVTWRVYY